MTSHYLDIQVVPDAETSAPQLLSTLYGRLHLALVEQKRDDIGVSFPRYSRNPKTLGPIVRLHSSAAELKALMDVDWLKGVRGHVRLSEILPVPADAEHRVVQRKQFKTNVDRLRRRRMQRKGETEEEAKKAIPSTVERKPDLPYVNLRSGSNKQNFCLFIQLSTAHSQPIVGRFNSYGLGGASIPWF